MGEAGHCRGEISQASVGVTGQVLAVGPLRSRTTLLSVSCVGSVSQAKLPACLPARGVSLTQTAA